VKRISDRLVIARLWRSARLLASGVFPNAVSPLNMKIFELAAWNAVWPGAGGG
jgi:hypothetical protein